MADAFFRIDSTMPLKIESPDGSLFPIVVSDDGVLQIQGLESICASRQNYIHGYDTTTQTIAQVNTFQDITISTDVEIDGWTHTEGQAGYTAAQSGKYAVCFYCHATKTEGITSFYEIIGTLNGNEISGSQAYKTIATNNITADLSGYFAMDVTAGDVFKFQATSGITTMGIKPPSGVSTTDISFGFTITRIA